MKTNYNFNCCLTKGYLFWCYAVCMTYARQSFHVWEELSRNILCMYVFVFFLTTEYLFYYYGDYWATQLKKSMEIVYWVSAIALFKNNHLGFVPRSYSIYNICKRITIYRYTRKKISSVQTRFTMLIILFLINILFPVISFCFPSSSLCHSSSYLAWRRH